jgi:hypothetical protein
MQCRAKLPKNHYHRALKQPFLHQNGHSKKYPDRS